MPQKPLLRSKWNVECPSQGPDQGHAGLWYEKLGGTWQDGWSLKADGKSSPKLEWMKPLLDKEIGSRQLLKEHAARQKKLIQHLDNALIRIQNKVYGICRESGKLISKERLRAVPHATLSIQAKQNKNNNKRK